MKYITALVVGLLICFSGAVYGKRVLSERFSLIIDPFSRKKVGVKVWKDIERFFVDAEYAIETENLEDLMKLYSDNYKNGDHSKKAAEEIWKRIFSKFDLMATHHDMRFLTTSSNSDMMIIRCSGLLMGIPAGGKNLITIDNWNDSDHVLIKEKDGWKLIGTSGRERKRFWFDKPMHPLF
jgi:hypothetical protein